ncbi:hypothetical protein DTW90_29950 [Neorhizobium sp. P12A]|uniref:hypothetical protein n=1 Tax=Neorhizobium sp. P12A TaxID=2268027 RepID=UPI0011ED8EB8|nr:hypothetical protein [Neorhizobium sp. P12A]KAA0690201.1 hypothetical protein DTW90_29950 [Neorhizobium sp. P12A]
MTVKLDTQAITLSGTCGIEEVEALIGYLESRPDLSVDLSTATVVHTALWQALIMHRAKITTASSPAPAVEKILSALDSSMIVANRGR